MAKRRRPPAGRVCTFCKKPLIRSKVGEMVRWTHPEPDNCPSPERKTHDDVDRVPYRVIDADGRASAPCRSKDILTLLAEKDVIDKSTLHAAEVFREKFYTACFNQLHSTDLLGSVRSARTHEDVVTIKVKRAQNYVISRIDQLGGGESFAGSCAWHVVGEQMSIYSWILRCPLPTKINAHTGRGILLAVLNMLASDPDSRTWPTKESKLQSHIPQKNESLRQLFA